MKNGFELINTARAWCHANHRLMTEIHYCLNDQYAIFVAEKLYEETENRFALFRWTEEKGIEVCKWYLFKSEALHLMIEKYDEMQGGAQ